MTYINVSVYSSYKRILVLISHSQDFLNGVCTNIVHMSKRRLKYYTGNYEAFVRTRMELLENQMKQYNWEQDQISHMKVCCTLLLLCSVCAQAPGAAQQEIWYNTIQDRWRL